MYIKGKTLQLECLHNILLIQLGDIGDVVYSLPCARALKENNPHCSIIMAVRKKATALLEDCRWVDDIIAVDTSKKGMLQGMRYQYAFWRRVRSFNFDLAVDLRTGSRGAVLSFLSGARQRLGRYNPPGHLWRGPMFTHLVLPEGRYNQYIAEYYLDTIAEYGLSTENIHPRLSPTMARREAARKLLQTEKVPSGKLLLAVQPFSLWQYKEWPEKNYPELFNRLSREFPLAVLLTGAPEERQRAEQIKNLCQGEVFNLAGKTSLALLPALLQEAALFLGVDSAGVHIAATVGTPTVSLYGPSPAEIWAPRGENHQVISKDLPCVPCKETGCGSSMRSRCMKELTVEEVFPILAKKITEILVQK